MTERFELRRFASELIDDAAQLLADRHHRHRQVWPALDPAFEDRAEARLVIQQPADQPGASGAIAFRAGQPAG